MSSPFSNVPIFYGEEGLIMLHQNFYLKIFNYPRLGVFLLGGHKGIDRELVSNFCKPRVYLIFDRFFFSYQNMQKLSDVQILAGAIVGLVQK